MMIERKRKILYFIQLPPPVHGVSIINELVIGSKTINHGFKKKLVEIRFSNQIKDLRKFGIFKLWSFCKTVYRLISALVTFGPDVVYFSFMPVGIGFLRDSIFALIIKIFRPRIIYHLHNRGISSYNNKILYKILYKIVFRNSSIIHLSGGLIDTEIKPLKIKSVKAYSINNTINPFKVSRRDTKSNKISILFLSNYFPQKGLMILLKAFNAICQKHPHIILNAYGASYSDLEDLKVQSFIKQYKLENRIFLHGPVYGDEKKKVFEDSDIFVFPSYFDECFPLVILEAMNAKLPIISSNTGAVPEIISNGKDGFLIDPFSPQQLTRMITLLVQNGDLREKFGQNASERFNKHYSLPIFEKKMKSIFNLHIKN